MAENTTSRSKDIGENSSLVFFFLHFHRKSSTFYKFAASKFEREKKRLLLYQGTGDALLKISLAEKNRNKNYRRVK